MDLTAVVPTHRPDPGRLTRTLAGLRAQTLPAARWETLLVDNASLPPVDPARYEPHAPGNLRILSEPVLGLTAARRAGFTSARGELIVLVDDDNVLAPGYLAEVLRLFAAAPALGALGGPSVPEFESPLPADLAEFVGLLACRDLGAGPQTAALRRDPVSGKIEYPLCAPIGAGMALRRAAAQAWLADPDSGRLSDRRGTALTSGGDNDIVLTVLRAGWSVGYFPSLSLTHLIPANRVDPAYLARLNRGIAASWMRVLSRHDACPWPPVPAWTVPIRQIKAWFTHRAWSSRAARIRWQGACGHFEGRASLRTSS